MQGLAGSRVGAAGVCWGVLSIMMPVYNEARTVAVVLERVLARPEVRDVIVVDDGSTDASWDIIERISAGDARVRALRQPRNVGKGAAVRLAIEHISAPLALVQDADLECDPNDYPLLLAPLLSGRADVVNGVRGFAARTAGGYWFVRGNQVLTTLANVLFNCNLNDLLSGYKVLPSDLWRRLNLSSRGFEVETEIVAKVLRLGYRFHEVPIAYVMRSRAEGKKIRTRDGLRIIATLARIRLTRRQRLFGTQRDGEYQRRQRPP